MTDKYVDTFFHKELPYELAHYAMNLGKNYISVYPQKIQILFVEDLEVSMIELPFPAIYSHSCNCAYKNNYSSSFSSSINPEIIIKKHPINMKTHAIADLIKHAAFSRLRMQLCTFLACGSLKIYGT